MEKLNPKRNSVLVVEDNATWRNNIVKLLKKAGYVCSAAINSSEAIRSYAKESPLVVLTDLKMDRPKEGMEVLEEVRRMDPEAVVILYTEFPSIENAVESLKMGAFDYIQKMSNSTDLLMPLERATKFARVQRENRLLRNKMDDLTGDAGFFGAVGVSAAIQEVFEKAKRVAQTNATVFITGDTGTGKEVLARGMHYYSPRRTHTFVPVAVSALPDTLLESELFGHARGSFTGALEKKGLFEAADQGTIFLDEIGEVGLDLQQKMLRVLQDKMIRRIGDVKEVAVDTRVISATNKDPETLVREKKMREDLYFRLNVIRLHMPSLTQRREDIPLLAYHFLNVYRYSGRVEVESINSDALMLMQQYDWPGNVRELQHAMEVMVALADHPQIRVQDLPDFIQPNHRQVFIPAPEEPLSFKDAKAKVVAEFEKHFIGKMLEHYHGNISKMADGIGLNRKTIYRLMEQHHLSPVKGQNKKEK